MLSHHYTDHIGHYTKDNNPIKEHFQLEYKNDWRLRYMNFLETGSNQDFVIILLNKIKQYQLPQYENHEEELDRSRVCHFLLQFWP